MVDALYVPYNEAVWENPALPVTVEDKEEFMRRRFLWKSMATVACWFVCQGDSTAANHEGDVQPIDFTTDVVHNYELLKEKQRGLRNAKRSATFHVPVSIEVLLAVFLAAVQVYVDQCYVDEPQERPMPRFLLQDTNSLKALEIILDALDVENDIIEETTLSDITIIHGFLSRQIVQW